MQVFIVAHDAFAQVVKAADDRSKKDNQNEDKHFPGQGGKEREDGAVEPGLFFGDVLEVGHAAAPDSGR